MTLWLQRSLFGVHGGRGMGVAVWVLFFTSAFPATGEIPSAVWWQRVESDGAAWLVEAQMFPSAGGECARMVYRRNGHVIDAGEAARFGLPPCAPESADISSQMSPPLSGAKSAASFASVWPALWEKSALPPVAPLVPIDIAAVLAEDQALGLDGAKDALRIGVFRDLPYPVTMENSGEWAVDALGNRYGFFHVASPGAVGIRLAFDVLQLPAGAELRIVGGEPPVVIPVPAPSSGAEAPFWAPACPGDNLAVVCKIPPDADTADVRISAGRLAHIYLDPLDGGKLDAGACNLDVACEPEWASLATAVGGLGTISTEGVLFCTCTLITDGNPCAGIPYVLTANHCVRGQTGTRGAEVLEFYWLYQNTSCNGAHPGLLTVPRTTGGADYLAGTGGTGETGGGSDFTLLRLRQEPPLELARAGWTTTVPAVATPVTCVHHPRGDFKRISHGTLSNLDNPYSAWFHEVRWGGGTTEGGSSGSPLVVSATGLIVGQLWGGTASCVSPFEPDYYGRFDKSWTMMKTFLAPPAANFAVTSVEVSEGAGSVSLPLSFSYPLPGAVDVGFVIDQGSALAGTDYTDNAGPRTLAPGGGLTLSIPILPNIHLDGDRTFTARLVAVSACAGVAAFSTQALVTIKDDDADTDGDGFSDVEESSGYFGYATDPLRADTDGDGLSDREESTGLRGFFTSPLLHDSDGDGDGDGVEIRNGLNPNDPADGHLLSAFTLPWFTP